MNDITGSAFNDETAATLSTLVEEGMECEFLDIMLRNIDFGIAILDQDLRYRMISNAVREQLLSSPDDIALGDPLSKMHEVMLKSGLLTPEIMAENALSAKEQRQNVEDGRNVSSRLVKMGDGTTHRFCRQVLDNGYTISVSNDVTELVEKTHLLNAALQLGRAAFWIYDIETKSYTLSETLRAILPEGGEEKVQKHGIFYMVSPEDKGRAKEALAKLTRENSRIELDMRTLVAAGTYRWTRTSAEIIYGPNGKPLKIRAFVRDIEAERRHEAELERMRDEAVHASKAKSEFLANMSHEIRTPMNGILGMAELLAGSNIDDRQREYVNVITSSATALLAIINDILDFSKIEAGALELDPTPFDLKSSVNDVTSLLTSTAQDKGLELIIDYPSSLPRHFIGDAGRIRQILTNLVGNAIKFTSEGYVQIEVRVEDDATNPDCPVIALDVKDTGIGIPQDKLQAIFDKFTQADGSTTRVYGGTGLGLAITKRISEMMGGRVEVTSDVGIGSTFGVRIPLERDHNAVVETFDIEALRGKHALIIDDIDVNRTILSNQLEGWGMTSECASHGIEAVEMLKANSLDPNTRNFDVILLDYLMPGVNGRELARILTNQSRMAVPKMVMLSSCDQSVSSQELEQIGIASYLVKPVRERRLFDTLGRVLSRKTVEAAPPSRPQTPTKPAETAAAAVVKPVTTAAETETQAPADPVTPAGQTESALGSLFDLSGFDRIASEAKPDEDLDMPVGGLLSAPPPASDKATPEVAAPTPAIPGPVVTPPVTMAEPALPTADLPETPSPALVDSPAETVTAPSADVSTQPETEAESRGRQEILVAEDFPLNRDVVRLMLVDTAFEPVFAENGKIASDMFMADADRFPLILMDVSMPVMDGYEATRTIRAFETETGASRAVPIIALTGHALKNDRQDCLDAGMTHYLTKPVKQNQLLEVLERYSGRAVDSAETRAA